MENLQTGSYSISSQNVYNVLTKWGKTDDESLSRLDKNQDGTIDEDELVYAQFTDDEHVEDSAGTGTSGNSGTSSGASSSSSSSQTTPQSAKEVLNQVSLYEKLRTNISQRIELLERELEKGASGRSEAEINADIASLRESDANMKSTIKDLLTQGIADLLAAEEEKAQQQQQQQQQTQGSNSTTQTQGSSSTTQTGQTGATNGTSDTQSTNNNNTNVSDSSVYNPAVGQQLKQAALNVAGTVGMCLSGVCGTLQTVFGASLYGIMSACNTLNALRGNDPQYAEVASHFKEVPASQYPDLSSLPAGAIVVWSRNGEGGISNEHGHISIALGDGRESSDHIQSQIDGINREHWIFLPC